MGFKEYLKESVSDLKKYNHVGWWEDSPITLFHGTRSKIFEQIKEAGGLTPTVAFDHLGVHGKVFLTPDPYSARGYSFMGGEYHFEKQKRPNPDKLGDRIVLAFKFKSSKFFIPSGRRKENLTNKDLYLDWIEQNGTKNDFQYYALSEVHTMKKVSLDNLIEVIKV